MSLFKSREWWSATCGIEHQNVDLSFASLCIANVDNSPDELNKIIVGSHAGVIYVFQPDEAPKHEGGGSKHLLLESQLALPILQLETGKFVSSSEATYLAVLHPRKLTVYGICSVASNVAHGFQYQLITLYEHNLERSAFKMITGSFGRVVGRDFICVMSLDGTISIFEQESYTFSRFLPGALIPGPLTYNSKTDSFIIGTCAFQLESYKYQGLALSSSSKSATSGQKLVADWSFNIGESTLDISVIIPRSGSSLIYVLGERHIFCFRDNGTMKFLKKLEFHPSCFHAFLNVESEEDDIIYIIVTHTGIAMIYHNVTLKWSTQMPLVPIFINRIHLRELQGGIVLLSDNGKLSCVYLGTNPAMYSPFPNKSRQINIEDTNKELEKLHRIIKAAQKSDIETGTPITNKSVPQLSVTATVQNKEVCLIPGNNNELSGNVPQFNLHVNLKAISQVQNVHVTIYLEESFNVSAPSFHFPVIGDSTILTVVISLREKMIPSDLSATITAVFTNLSGLSEIVQTVIDLPLKVVVAACSPTKDAEFKVTICMNKQPIKLDDLFTDIRGSGEFESNQIGFQYYGGPIVTILMAKTSQRYRLQSDHFEGIALILKELLSRLENWFSKSKSHDRLICSYQNDIPLQDFYLIVNAHLQNRQRADMYAKRLSQLASQIRAIQKRLLFKYKDKSANPLSNLESLFESTFKQMSTVVVAMESHRTILERSLRSVIAASRLICLLLKLYTNMSDAEFQLLSKVMNSNISDECDQGWEEVVTAGLETLLQTTFCRGSVEGSMLEVKLKMPENLEYLKKQLNGVIDFVARGTLIEKSEGPEQLIKDGEIETKEKPENLLLGTQFGERVLRNQSANIKEIEDLNNGTEKFENQEYFKTTPAINESYDRLPDDLEEF